MQNDTTYREVKRHVERKVGFYMHLAVYLTVNTGLLLANALSSSGKPWSIWPLLGWGIGLLFHGFAVHLNKPEATWKQRMIDKEMKKLRQ